MKILYVTTVSNTVNAFLIPHIKLLFDMGHCVDVAFRIDKPVRPEISELGCKVYDVPFQRSPLDRRNVVASKTLKGIITREGYDLIHTHTPVASACVRVICRKMPNVRVFYTAHGFHFFKGAPLRNWLLYYPAEKLLSRNTDTLLTINQEDFARAKSTMRARRVEFVPGVGLDISRFSRNSMTSTHKRMEIGVPFEAFVVLSVGELNKNKNHEVIIRAMAILKEPRVHYVVCGRGPMLTHLIELSRELDLERRVHLLGVREDIPDICSLSDIYAHPSLREGLPVALMEAMAAGLPVICSDIRGNRDLIEDRSGGFLLRPNDPEGFANAIKELFDSEKLRSKFSTINVVNVQQYSISNVLSRLEAIYDG